MTPDLKRLCEAAATVSLAGEGPNDTNAQIYERIVRAVLMEMEGTLCLRVLDEGFSAVISSILAQPASA